MRFDIEGAGLKNATLREVLIWAYQRYVLKPLVVPARETILATQQGM